MAKPPALSSFEGGRDRVPALYADPANWPLFDSNLLTGDVKKRFDRLQAAVGKYLAFAPIDEVSKIAGIGKKQFLKLFRRCGIVNPDGQIVGWAALVRGRSVAPRVRTAAVMAAPGSRAGWSGAFRQLLAEKPEIADRLTTYLNGYGVHGLRPNKVAFRRIHKAFKGYCRDAGVKEDEYPLNTKECGRKALRRWVDEDYLPAHAQRFIGLEHGPDAAGLYGYGGGDGAAKLPSAPYSVWQLDEVTIDVAARYEIPNPSGDWEELDLRRFFALRLKDKGSGANLALRIVFAAQANADDIAALFWDALNGPPEIPQPVEGNMLLEGAAYPANAIKELRSAIPSEVELDRALAHLAGHAQSIGTTLIGGRVILGAARTPRERAQIESAFAKQARQFLHELPATTGTGPKDPVRKRAAVAIEGRLRATELEQGLDAYVMNENVTAAAASNYISPLDRLRRQLAAGVLKPVYLAPEKRKPHYFSQPVRVKVKADLKRGTRPFINYLYQKYSSGQLGKDFALVDQYLWLRPDVRNLRTVMLFRESGELYGSAQVLGAWAQFPHDQRIRRLHGRLKRAGLMGDRADDLPLEALFTHLRAKAPRDRTAALQLTHLVEYLTRNEVPLTEVLAVESPLIS